jgi:hypothetical protein
VEVRTPPGSLCDGRIGGERDRTTFYAENHRALSGLAAMFGAFAGH